MSLSVLKLGVICTGVVMTLLLTRGGGCSSHCGPFWSSGLLHMRGRQVRAYLAYRGEPLKMTLVVRKDLKMSIGKIAAQCAHAAVGVVENVQNRRCDGVTSSYSSSDDKEIVDGDDWVMWYDAWRLAGSTKVALQCESEEKLMEAYQAAKREGLPYTLVRDAGRTQIAPGSKTVLAVGPAPVTLVDRVTGHFKLL